MALRLITATERLAESNSKDTIGIFGPYGIGKTSLLHTLDEETTLFINLEAGEKSVQTWLGDSIPVRTWQDAWDVACLVGGADPAITDNAKAFSAAHHTHVMSVYGGMIDMSRYRLIFVDSITDLTRLGMIWADQQPEAFAERKDGTIVKNLLGAYGLLGREAIRILKHLQHAPAKSIVFVGGLEKHIDEFKRVTWEPQMEGGKSGREFPFIVDNVITMDLFDYSETTGWRHVPTAGKHRVFCCRSPNPWGLPAKDRSGQLEMIEEPHLGKLIEKINRPARSASERLQTALPTL